MYYFLKRVGCNYGVVDSEDGAIDWLTKEELQRIVKDGVSIEGINEDCSEFVPQLVILNAKLCNWADGQNVFTNVKWFNLSRDGSFKMRAGNKTFKGTLINSGDKLGLLVFNYGVRVLMSIQEYVALLDADKAVDVLRGLPVPTKSADSDEQAYFDALDSGNYLEAIWAVDAMIAAGKWPMKADKTVSDGDA